VKDWLLPWLTDTEPEGEMVPPVPAEALIVKVVRPKVAATDVFAFIEIEHVPVPTQPPPDQPVKFELLSGDAVNVTTVPAL